MKYRIIVVMAAILWVGLAHARHCHINRSIFQAIRAQGAGPLRLAEAAAFDWDDVYLFHPYTPRGEVCAILRIDPVACKVAVWFESRDDDEMSLAFVRAGGLVRYHYHHRATGDFTSAPHGQPIARGDAVFRIVADDATLGKARRYRLVQRPSGGAAAG